MNIMHLTIHYVRCKPALISIAGAIGKPLRADHATAAVIWPSVARVLIEYDVYRPPIPQIWIGAGDSGFWQPVIFERIPAYCASCKDLVHSSEEYVLANLGLQKPQWPSGETQATKGCDQAPVDHGQIYGSTSPLVICIALLAQALRVQNSVSEPRVQDDGGLRDHAALSGIEECAEDTIPPSISDVPAQRESAGTTFFRNVMDDIHTGVVGFNANLRCGF